MITKPLFPLRTDIGLDKIKNSVSTDGTLELFKSYLESRSDLDTESSEVIELLNLNKTYTLPKNKNTLIFKSVNPNLSGSLKLYFSNETARDIFVVLDPMGGNTVNLEVDGYEQPNSECFNRTVYRFRRLISQGDYRLVSKTVDMYMFEQSEFEMEDFVALDINTGNND